jgi:nucleotide-binding universal stress UspA family protein
MIVVGIDGSAGSRAALRFAAEEADLRKTTLKVVSAWHLPTGLYTAPTYVNLDLDVLRKDAAGIADQELVEVLGADRAKALEVVIREGNAAEALLEESRGAEMLVVGSRGHGGFAGLLLGSVSQQCSAHAACPVVVVRDHHPG